MSTVIYPSPIFGPVHSRRLGVSLGVNLLPEDGKLCTFDCIYCECGFNADRRPRRPRPTREEVRLHLEQKLQQMKTDGLPPDVITFAGNGEPTLHPDFPAIIDDTLELRRRYFPAAKVSVLSNATRCGLPAVREALKRVDCNILKLDTVDEAYIRRVDRPQVAYDVEQVVQNLCAFEGHVVVQTLFMCGAYDGHDADNTSDSYVLPWLEALRRIRPQSVMIYTIARETPAAGLAKTPVATLDAIAAKVRALGLECSVSY